MFKHTGINNLKTTVYFDGGMDITLEQLSSVPVDVEFRDGKIVSVKAPFGIVFVAGGMRVSMPDYYDVTDLCDLPDILKRLAAEQGERDEMRIHTSARASVREFLRPAL